MMSKFAVGRGGALLLSVSLDVCAKGKCGDEKGLILCHSLSNHPLTLGPTRVLLTHSKRSEKNFEGK